jgi:hypothetical protein
MKTTLTLIALAAILLLPGCYYDSEETLYPSLNSACDTTNVRFSSQILATLRSNCFGCHSNNNAGAFGDGITLENPEDVQTMYNKIYASISHAPGARQMPKNSAKLSDCAIRQFAIWKENGFPQ